MRSGSKSATSSSNTMQVLTSLMKDICAKLHSAQYCEELRAALLRALKEDFSSGEQRNILTLPILQHLIGMFPQVFEHGCDTFAGSLLLILVPELARHHLITVHDQIVETIYDIVICMAQSVEHAPVRMLFQDLVDLMAVALEHPDAILVVNASALLERDVISCLKRLHLLTQQRGQHHDSFEPVVKIRSQSARNQLLDATIRIMVKTLSGSPHILDRITHSAWELLLRTMLNHPYSKSRKTLELLACLCENYDTPTKWGDMLCQSLAWAIRCENRLMVHEDKTITHNEDAVNLKSKDTWSRESPPQSGARNLARCIEAAFHTLPAAVRHVHAENWVAWTFEYLEAFCPRSSELCCALIGTLDIIFCECPSLVPNIMRLSEVIHEIPLKDAISACIKRVFNLLFLSPAHNDALIPVLRGRRESGEVVVGSSLGGVIKLESDQNHDMREGGRDEGGSHKRPRSLAGAKLGANNQHSMPRGCENATDMRPPRSVTDVPTNVVVDELLTQFFKACLNCKRAEASGGDHINAQTATRQRGLFLIMCVASEFVQEGMQNTGEQFNHMRSCIVSTIVHFMQQITSQRNAISKIAANGNLVLFLQALRTCSNWKLPAAFSSRICMIIESCIALCEPRVAGEVARNDESCRTQLVEMVMTLGGLSARLLTSDAPKAFFLEALQSSEERIAAAAVVQLPGFILRCPTAAASAHEVLSLLRCRLYADDSSSALKALIPRALGHIVCAVCAIRSCNGDTKKIIKLQPGMDAKDPIEAFLLRHSLYFESYGAEIMSEEISFEAHASIHCCSDRFDALYGSTEKGHIPTLPLSAQRGTGVNQSKDSSSSSGSDPNEVWSLAKNAFALLRDILKPAHASLDPSILQSVLLAIPVVSLHLSRRSLEREGWLLDYFLEIVSGATHCIKLRSCAAASIAWLASGHGMCLKEISGCESFCMACDKVIDKVRDVYANLPPEPRESELKAAGCIQVEAFMCAVIDDLRHYGGGGNILKIICTDLVTTAIQNLAVGEIRKTNSAYGSLEFVAEARGMSIEDLLAYSHCREQVLVLLIKYIGEADGRREGHQDLRMIKAYLDLFGDGRGKDVVGDDDKCCIQFVEIIFKDIAHKVLMLDDDGQLVGRIAKYLQLEPHELIANNLQYIIKNIYFSGTKPGQQAARERACQLIKQRIGVDAKEAACEQPICYDYLLQNVLWEVSQYTEEADKAAGREMFVMLCRWLLSESEDVQSPSVQQHPLEAILSLEKHRDFYTNWIFDLKKNCFEDSNFQADSPELQKKRHEMLMVLDFTIPLLGKSLDQMLVHILGTLNKAKQFEELKEQLCDVWHTLVRNCGCKSKPMKSRLPQIVMTLLQLGAKYPNKVRPTLQMLVVDWRAQLGSEFKKVPDLTLKHEELTEFFDRLTEVRVSASDSLPAMLALSIDGVKSEDDDMQENHLMTLKNGIHLHFEAVLQTLSGFTSKDLEMRGKGKVAELIHLLLAKCTHNSFCVRKGAVACLGQLGAVEPSRIPAMERLVQNAAEQSDDDFAIEIVNEHIVRMLMSSSRHNRTSKSGVVELALQELLKFLEIDKTKESQTSPAKIFRHSSTQFATPHYQPSPAHGSTDSKRGRENWTKIEHKDFIKPFLFTSFLNETKASHEPQKAIFRTGMHYANWVRQFCVEVVMRCKGPRGDLLSKIHALLKKDYELARFVLGPAVLHLICSGNEDDIGFVSNELKSVLNHALDSGACDEGEVGDKLGVDCFSLRSSIDMPPTPVEILGMELKASLVESRNIFKAQSDKNGLTVVHVLPPFTNTLSVETSSVAYSIAKGECSGTNHEKIEGSTQVVFKIFDNLTSMLEHYSRAAAARGRHYSEEVRTKKQALQCFVMRIPRRILAHASCQCSAYDRALLYLEEAIREKWQLKHTRDASGQLPPPLAALLLRRGLYEETEKEEVLSTFHQIYAGLEDDDELVGISKLRKDMSLAENIKTYELGGDWNQALACYEQALKQSPCASTYIDYLQCLRNLGHLQAMLTQALGEIRNYPFHAHEFRASALQASWRLGRWDLTEDLLRAAQKNNDFGGKQPFENRLASVLLAMQKHDQPGATKGINSLLQCVMGPLAAASIESYQRAYPHMIRLHMINEIERSFRIIFTPTRQPTGEEQRRREIQQLRGEWDMRLELTQPSMGEREPLLALRRSLFSIMGVWEAAADGWLEFAKSARRAGHASTANSAILQAESLKAPTAFLERVKLQWCHENDRQQALNWLRSCIDRRLPSLQSAATRSQGEASAALKAVVLYWKWVQAIGLQQTSEVIKGLEADLSKINVRLTDIEKKHFMLGQLYESLAFPHRNTCVDGMFASSVSAGNSNTTQAKESQYLAKVLEKYGNSLRCGHKHIFQSLPRLLTLWFENVDRVSQDTENAMHQIMVRLTTELPAYIWLTVYPQLISRICHPNEKVLEILKNNIARVLAKYPRQSLWALAAVIRSREEQRVMPAKAILAKLSKVDFFDGRREDKKAAQADFEAAKRAFLGASEESGGFAGELVTLCRITLSKESSQDKKRSYSMSKDCRNLVRSIRESPNQVLMPVEAMLVPNLPRDGKTDTNYKPFPPEETYIKGFGEAIDVMTSMMSPVKVRFQGSDGNEYRFLAKPKDDLRKDTRMMEFNTMINRLLVRDADARRRNLHLRTFTVIPMNESTGILQWVDNTEVFRSIIDKQISKFMPKNYHGTSYVRTIMKPLPEGMLNLETYHHLVRVYNPVFYRWFFETFSDPAAWTAARNTYVRTTAVWSIVGYVVGLGDRHTENILFDSTSGACVHVDFACMFNKGETLKIAERVPFRLTHNMVDAMGVSGYGGGYEQTCRHTMRVLRANREALMNVLETCVHDPLVEFVRKGEDAKDRLNRCERRLRGEVTRFPHARDIRQVLSVEGQVESVIAEAISPSNLCQMYRWWMAWY